METRERLLEAAIAVLRTHGYARATTRAIVGEAGAHLPSVNYFFGSKDRLLQEAVIEGLRRWGRSTMAEYDQPTSGTPRDRLAQRLERFYATLEDDRSYVIAAMEAFAQAERDDDLRRQLASAYDEFRLVVLAALRPERRSDEADLATEALANVLIALFDGLAIQWLLNPAGGSRQPDVLEGLAALARFFPTEPPVFEGG